MTYEFLPYYKYNVNNLKLFFLVYGNWITIYFLCARPGRANPDLAIKINADPKYF